MPGFRSRGRGRRMGRARAAKAYRRRRYARRAPGGRSGGIFVVRKTAAINIVSVSGVSGAWQLNDPTGTCVTIGTPVYLAGTQSIYDTPFSMKFNLGQLMNSTDITNIADRYKITKAVVRIHNNFNQMGNVQSGATPWLEWYNDSDDAVVPTLANVRETMGVKTVYFTASKPSTTLVCRPRFADTIFNSGITSAYGLGRRSEYINSTYPLVEHYGLKGVIHNVQLNGVGAASNLIDFDVTLHVSAKDIQ